MKIEVTRKFLYSGLAASPAADTCSETLLPVPHFTNSQQARQIKIPILQLPSIHPSSQAAVFPKTAALPSMSTNTMEQRKAEIAAKKAKLAEIKRRNAERQQSLSMSRRSADISEVRPWTSQGSLTPAG